jgi:hypothetical protein
MLSSTFLTTLLPPEQQTNRCLAAGLQQPPHKLRMPGYRLPRPHTPSWRILTTNNKFCLSKYRIDTNVSWQNLPGTIKNWLLEFLSLLCVSHVAFERRKTLSCNPWLFSTRNERSLADLANSAGRVIVWLWQHSCIWNKDTVLYRSNVHCNQHNGRPLQTRSTARGVGLEKDKVSRYKKIYRFSATYDVSFSLCNCATPQRRIFMVHKFSSKLMFSQTPDMPRFIVPTASKRLRWTVVIWYSFQHLLYFSLQI